MSRATSRGAPGGFGRSGAVRSTLLARDRHAPRMIYVTLQHPSPYYDDSYGVNSANNGPFGDAIMQELIPAVEIEVPRHSRAVGAHADRRIDRRMDRARAPGLLSRLLRRRRSRCCPDAVDFRYHQIVNIYDDANAYFVEQGLDEDRAPESAPSRRQHRIDDEGRELVRAGRRRQVALGRPVGYLGSDVQPGRPRRLPEADLEQATGAIDKTVAE